jgi:hypothetical protein
MFFASNDKLADRKVRFRLSQRYRCTSCWHWLCVIDSESFILFSAKVSLSR